MKTSVNLFGEVLRIVGRRLVQLLLQLLDDLSRLEDADGVEGETRFVADERSETGSRSTASRRVIAAAGAEGGGELSGVITVILWAWFRVVVVGERDSQQG